VAAVWVESKRWSLTIVRLENAQSLESGLGASETRYEVSEASV